MASFFSTVSHGYFFLFVESCPVFNVGAKKLDTMSCLQSRCPPYNYRSNDINVGMYLYVFTIYITQTTIFCSFFIKKTGNIGDIFEILTRTCNCSAQGSYL